MPMTRRQGGFTLLEILIAIVIFSIGLLGIAGLQVAGMRFTHGSQLRSIAVAQAESMSDLMRANEFAVQAGYYNVQEDMPTSASPDCAAVVCDAQQRATYDLVAWNVHTEGAPLQSNEDVLPSGTGVVCRDSTPNDGDSSGWSCDNAGEVYAIKIQWVERTTGKDDLGRSGNDDEDQVVQRLVMTVVPGLDLN
ncbi:type IV pilus modification protein PilV [Hydrogenophaga sp.]|uniref:type IV pilus modification protein PilV n=1 Tax=Hydrogenophaga sp. TaxID=1904254 RepID=UPI003D0EE2E5